MDHPWDKFPEDYSTWEECVKEYRLLKQQNKEMQLVFDVLNVAVDNLARDYDVNPSTYIDEAITIVKGLENE